ncbi:MAG: MFS transporter, partial [Alphaproteobacteria bacterium]|nr:MFS transporter [Alphaproteobacteria bacterium]
MSSLISNLRFLKSIISPLTAFFAGTALTCCAYALLTSALGLRMAENQVSTFTAGIVLSLYYLGYIVASKTSNKIINRVGHIRAFSTYISIFSAIALLHYFSQAPFYWAILRMTAGYCMGSAFMCLESWLNTRANNNNRGLLMSLYMVTSYLGASSGQLLLNIPDANGITIYIVVSVIFSFALVPVSLTALPSPAIEVHKSMSLSRLYKISPIGVVGCMCSGIFVGTFYSLGAIYATQIGLDVKMTSLFMFFGVLGGLLIQFPLGRLSDKMDRRFVIMWVASILFFIAPWVHFWLGSNIIMLAFCAIMLGAGTFIIYPISVSHVNDLIDDEDRVNASGMMIMLQSIGMICGPIVISYFMGIFGPIAFALAYSITAAGFVVFALKHISFKPDVGYKNITPTAPMPIDTTHAFHELATDDKLSTFAKIRQALIQRIRR